MTDNEYLASRAMADDAQVICPGCAHQFRAIPVQVQELLLAAGYEPPFTAVQPPQDERGQPVALTDDIQAIKRTALDCMPGDEKQALVRIVRQCIDLQKAVASAPALPPSGVEAGYGNNKVTLTGPAPTLQAGQGEPLALSTLTDDLDWWLDLAQRHANADWNSEQPDGFLNAVKALCRDFAMSQGRQP